MNVRRLAAVREDKKGKGKSKNGRKKRLTKKKKI